MTRLPLPPFTDETAAIKVRAAKDGWNGQDPAKIALAYSEDSQWRNRAVFLNGRTEIETFRSYSNENWEFDDNGLMRRRIASINDAPISETDCKFHWPLGRRPDDHPGLSDLGL